jgi:hypothetical protein
LISWAASPVQLSDVKIRGELVGAEPDGSAVYTTSYVYSYDGYSSMSSYGFNRYALGAQGATLAWSVQFDNQSITSARVSGGKAFLTLASGVYYYGYGYAVAPGGGVAYGAEGDMKVGAPSASLARTDLVVLDLAASGPAIAGKLGMDGYASIQDVSGDTVFVYGEGVVAAYTFTGGALGFDGGLALRGYVNHIRAFEGGALISEGLYGTETLRY